MWGVAVTFVIFTWLAVMRSEPRHRAVVPTIAPSNGLPFGNRSAWFVALFFAFQNFVFYGLLVWSRRFTVKVGPSSTAAGLVLASLPVAFMLGNFVLGWLIAAYDRRLAL